MDIIKNPSRKARSNRLISTVGLSRGDWLEIRNRGIGSSDAAAAVGLNPYQSALELWMTKTGKANIFSESAQDENSPLYWGTILEPIVAEHYTQKTGRKVRRINAVLQHAHSDKQFMLANIDRIVVANPEVQILECKTAGINGARLWRDGVPQYVQIQVQHQLAVTGHLAADVAVLIGGQQLEIHRIVRDEKLIEWLIEQERAFWQLVESDIPPAPDGSDSSGKAIQALFPDSGDETKDFTEDAKLSWVFADWLEARHRIAELDKHESALKQTLQIAMGSATLGVFETGQVSWKRSKDSITLDVQKVLVDHPDFIERYPLVRQGSRRFTVH